MRWFIRVFLFVLIFELSASIIQAQADINHILEYIEDARKAWNVPGMSVGIVHDGKVYFAGGFGQLETGNPGAVNEHSLFAIASNTKAFIAAALGILVEEGQLNWDDPVRKYLPYFELYDSYAGAHTTVRDLLCHRVGQGTFSGDVIWYKSRYTAEETVRRARHVPQAYSFRAGYGYSNLMYIAAGEVIEAVSGKPWDVFIKEKFFLHLGMNRTVTSVIDLNGMTNIATPHKNKDQTNQPIPYVNWDNMGAAGGIISSAYDMTRWMLMQLNKGSWEEKDYFSQGQQIEWWTPHNSFRVQPAAKENLRNQNFSGYGLGWSLSDYNGYLVASHGGGYDGMYSRVTLVPDLGLGIVVLTNAMRGISNPVTHYIMDRFMRLDEKDWSKHDLERALIAEGRDKAKLEAMRSARVSDTTPALTAGDISGTYICKMYGNIDIAMEGESLRMRIPHAPALSATLRHWHYDVYEIIWDEEHAWFDFGTIQFVKDNHNKVTGIEFDVPNHDIFFHEIRAVKQ
jgi:CubicO group peptidase (beta-lactamase class C family)